MSTAVLNQAIRNRLHWYLSRNPRKYQEARTDAEDWALRYAEGIGTLITAKEREQILQIINQELIQLMNAELMQHSTH